MNFSRNEIYPDDPEQLPPARRRRAQRLLVPLDLDEQAHFLDLLAHRAAPSIDFFLFSLVSGLVLGLAILLDQPGLMVLGILLAPLMAPMIGVSLGVMVGSVSFFLRSTAGLFVGSFFVFSGGMFMGLVSRYWFPGGETYTILGQIHARISWTYGLVLALGAISTAVTFTRHPDRARLPSVALAYGLYVPLAVAGFGVLAQGNPTQIPQVNYFWPDGLLVFVLHFAVAGILGAFVLGLLGYRPPTLFGYTLWGALALLLIVALVGVTSIGVAIGGQVGVPTFTPSPTSTYTPTPSQTPTPAPPTATATFTLTPSPVPPTLTYTPSPVPPTSTAAPVFAVVSAEGDTGARIRATPQGDTLTVLANGTTVQVLEPPLDVNGETWLHVLTSDGIEGWMLSLVLTIATPAPDWSP